jgi:hypothetical protein
VSQRQSRETSANPSPPVAERRAHKRFIEEVRVRYRDIEGNEPARWGLSRDLSLGGLCLLAEEDVAMGCHLAVEIHIQSETAPVLALGRVVRSGEQDDEHCVAGIQFLWVGQEDRANLERLAGYFREKYGETGDLRSLSD